VYFGEGHELSNVTAARVPKRAILRMLSHPEVERLLGRIALRSLAFAKSVHSSRD